MISLFSSVGEFHFVEFSEFRGDLAVRVDVENRDFEHIVFVDLSHVKFGEIQTCGFLKKGGDDGDGDLCARLQGHVSLRV